MPPTHLSSSALVPNALPIRTLPAAIDGRTELMWLPPDKLPAGGAFVHIAECPDRLANVSSLLDINNLCNRQWWASKEEMGLRATSYVRPERPGLFFSAEGRHKEVLAFVMPAAETAVVAGWPHDQWGVQTVKQTICPVSETPGEYAQRRLNHFVRHCGQRDANRWWAGNFTCFYRSRAAIEERQYAYLDLVKANGTMCPPGQLHNQIMVHWQPDKISHIFHTENARDAAKRLKTLLPNRQLWQYDVNVSPLLEHCDTCCHEPNCPNPLTAKTKAATPPTKAPPTPTKAPPTPIKAPPTPTKEAPPQTTKEAPPTKAPTNAPTNAPTEAQTSPTKAPTAPCSANCSDVQPPSEKKWRNPTCAGQLASGKCAERVSLADGYCERTCGICVACPSPTVQEGLSEQITNHPHPRRRHTDTDTPAHNRKQQRASAAQGVGSSKRKKGARRQRTNRKQKKRKPKFTGNGIALDPARRVVALLSDSVLA